MPSQKVYWLGRLYGFIMSGRNLGISLFSGCGGLDLGFSQAGFNVTAAFDNDATAVDCHRLNLTGSAHLCDLASGLGSFSLLASPSLLLAGPPCQGFSTAGKRLVGDPRNGLLLKAAAIAVKIRPSVIVLENVPAAASGEHGQYWASLRQMLRIAGYRTIDLLCSAVDYGLPQQRRRLILIGWNTGRDIRGCPRQHRAPTLRSTLHSPPIPEQPSPALRLCGVSAIIARHIRAGQKLSNVRGGPNAVHTWNIPQVFGRTNARERFILETILKLRRQDRKRDCGDADPVSLKRLATKVGPNTLVAVRSLVVKGYLRRLGGLIDLTHTFNGKYRRLSWDCPAPTVDTRFTSPRYFLHPDEDRGMTIREAARIQGFPDWFSFLGSDDEQIRLIGNAVPPPLARSLAEYVREAILS